MSSSDPTLVTGIATPGVSTVGVIGSDGAGKSKILSASEIRTAVGVSEGTIYKKDRYFSPYDHRQTLGTIALAQNAFLAIPMPLIRRRTWHRLGINVTTPASGNPTLVGWMKAPSVNAVVAYPSGIASGDLIISVRFGGGTVPTPSGFTSLNFVSGAGRISYKIASGSESGNLSATFEVFRDYLIVYRNAGLPIVTGITNVANAIPTITLAQLSGVCVFSYGGGTPSADSNWTIQNNAAFDKVVTRNGTVAAGSFNPATSGLTFAGLDGDYIATIGFAAQSASANARLSIYADNLNGDPVGAAVVSGTVSVVTSGEKEISFTQLLNPGWYWLVVQAEQAISITSLDALDSWQPPIIGAASGTGLSPGYRTGAISYGAAPTLVAGDLTLVDVTNCPRIWLRSTTELSAEA
jgi:hypothetical protein